MAELTGPPIGFPGGTSVIYTTPFPLQLGTRARDSSGNEYILCSFTDEMNAGQPCQISSAFGATILAVTGRGPLGVVVAGQATSAAAGWVQIYGKVMMMIIDGLSQGGTQPSPSDAANGPTTLATSVPTVFALSTSITSPHSLTWVSGNASTASGIYVEGMSVAQDAAPAAVSNFTFTTNASARHTGAAISVFLSYPVLRHRNYGE
jgi:hypothetical protein